MKNFRSFFRVAALALATQLPQNSNAAPLNNGFVHAVPLVHNGTRLGGTLDLQLRLMDAPLGGNPVTPNTLIYEDITVAAGEFKAYFDFGPDAFKGDQRWLEISFRPADETGPFTTLEAREWISPVPYALYSPHAGHATTAGAADSANHAQTAQSAQTAQTAANASLAEMAKHVPWAGITGLPAGFADGIDHDTHYSAGPGLNLTAPNVFSVNFAPNGSSVLVARSDHGHFGQSWSGAALTGLKVENGFNSGIGVLGRQGSANAMANSIVAGVLGDSAYGDGVVGISGSLRGIFGASTGTAGLRYGVHGLSLSGAGVGVLGQNSATTGNAIGAKGEADSVSGVGVLGHAKANSGQTVGVRGKANSPSGAGVAAEGSGAGGTALLISNGGIRVNSAGVGTATPVFIHQVTQANRDGDSFTSKTMINNPYCNGDPNAMLIVIPRNVGTQQGPPTGSPSSVDSVTYLFDPADPGAVQKGRWWIVCNQSGAMDVGEQYVVMVVKP